MSDFITPKTPLGPQMPPAIAPTMPKAPQAKTVTTPAAPPTPPAPTTPPAATPPATTPPDTTNPYGSIGNVDQLLQGAGSGALPANLPPWLAQQFFQTQGNGGTSGGDGGTPNSATQWSYKYNLTDQAGNAVIQLGKSPDQIPAFDGKQGSIIDKSLVTYDPVLGWVTPPSNIQEVNDSGRFAAEAVGAVLTAGTVGDFLLAGEAGAGGAASIPSAADGLTPGINNAIDTSLLPSVTPPPIGDIPPPPTFDALPPGLDVPPPVAGGGGAGVPDPIGAPYAPPGGDVFNPTMQPPPNVDVPPPNFNVTSPPGIGDRVLNSLTNDPLRTAGTALGIGSLLGNHANAIPSSLTNTVNNNSAVNPAANATLANNGAPTSDQMAVITGTINQQRTQGTEAIIQASINAGQGGKDSLVTQDKIRAFNEQLTVMQNELVQKQAEQNVSVAMQELGMMTQEQFQLAQLQLQQDNAAQQRAMSIMQSLGWLFSGGGKGTNAPATG